MGKRVDEMIYHLIIDYCADGDSRFNIHVNGISYLFLSWVKYSRLNLNPNLSDSEIIKILNESPNSYVCSESFFDFRNYFKTEFDRHEYYKFKKLSELLEFIEERILIEELKK